MQAQRLDRVWLAVSRPIGTTMSAELRRTRRYVAGLEVVVGVLTQDATLIPVGASTLIERWGGKNIQVWHARLCRASSGSQGRAISSLNIARANVYGRSSRYLSAVDDRSG